MHQTIHKPVLLGAVLTYLAPERGNSYLDLTAGYGGHAGAVLEHTQAPSRMTLVDRDKTAVNALTSFERQGATVLHASFEEASATLQSGGERFDMILADLGVSSLHLDTSSRGFAFRSTGPLDMRMDQRAELTAATVVNTYSQVELEGILRQYGEEPRARTIVAAIVNKRPFSTTTELAEAIAHVMPRGSKVHPATRSFQAIRIAVNDELGQLERSLPMWFQLLKPGGRLGVISFHSLEDRIVKQAFADVAGDRYDADYRLLTKHPVVADDTETVSNPRARSAKLRVLQRK